MKYKKICQYRCKSLHFLKVRRRKKKRIIPTTHQPFEKFCLKKESPEENDRSTASLSFRTNTKRRTQIKRRVKLKNIP